MRIANNVPRAHREETSISEGFPALFLRALVVALAVLLVPVCVHSHTHTRVVACVSVVLGWHFLLASRPGDVNVYLWNDPPTERHSVRLRKLRSANEPIRTVRRFPRRNEPPWERRGACPSVVASPIPPLSKQLPVYINPRLHSQTRKLRNFETTWPCAFHATHAPVSLFPCTPHHRAPGMEAESTSGGSKERPFSPSIYRAYMYFFNARK